MNDYINIITQDDIDNNMSDAVLENHALSDNGLSMQADIKKVINGEEGTIRVAFEILNDEEPDNENIYTTSRILSAVAID